MGSIPSKSHPCNSDAILPKSVKIKQCEITVSREYSLKKNKKKEKKTPLYKK